MFFLFVFFLHCLGHKCTTCKDSQFCTTWMIWKLPNKELYLHGSDLQPVHHFHNSCIQRYFHTKKKFWDTIIAFCTYKDTQSSDYTYLTSSITACLSILTLCSATVTIHLSSHSVISAADKQLSGWWAQTSSWKPFKVAIQTDMAVSQTKKQNSYLLILPFYSLKCV